MLMIFPLLAIDGLNKPHAFTHDKYTRPKACWAARDAPPDPRLAKLYKTVNETFSSLFEMPTFTACTFCASQKHQRNDLRIRLARA